MSIVNRNKTAKVIRFNRRRGFGIAKYQGKTIIFHVRNYSQVEIANGRRDGSVKFGSKIKCESLPETGDRIYFKGGARKDRTTEQTRLSAVAWFFKEDLSKKIASKKRNKRLGRVIRSRKRRRLKYTHPIPCYS